MTHKEKHYLAVEKAANEFADKWSNSPYTEWSRIYLAYKAGAKHKWEDDEDFGIDDGGEVLPAGNHLEETLDMMLNFNPLNDYSRSPDTENPMQEESKEDTSGVDQVAKLRKELHQAYQSINLMMDEINSWKHKCDCGNEVTLTIKTPHS